MVEKLLGTEGPPLALRDPLIALRCCYELPSTSELRSNTEHVLAPPKIYSIVDAFNITFLLPGDRGRSKWSCRMHAQQRIPRLALTGGMHSMGRGGEDGMERKKKSGPTVLRVEGRWGFRVISADWTNLAYMESERANLSWQYRAN